MSTWLEPAEGAARAGDQPRTGIPWYAAVAVVVVLGSVASVVDWALGDGPGLATGVGFVLGCFVLGGRIRLDHAVVAIVGAPLCFAAVVVVTAVAQLIRDDAFAAVFGVYWTYALTAGAPWLFAGTAVSCLLAALRRVRHRR